jgi:hypothetical protein
LVDTALGGSARRTIAQVTSGPVAERRPRDPARRVGRSRRIGYGELPGGYPMTRRGQSSMAPPRRGDLRVTEVGFMIPGDRTDQDSRSTGHRGHLE